MDKRKLTSWNVQPVTVRWNLHFTVERVGIGKLKFSPVLDPHWSVRHGLEYIPQLNNYEANEITYQGDAPTAEYGETSVSIF